MQHANRSNEATPKAPPVVPWWKRNKQLALPFDAGPSAPDAPERAADDPPSKPDRTRSTPCPGTLPEGVRDTYVSVFGLPALHPANAPEVPTRCPVDADAPRAEVVV